VLSYFGLRKVFFFFFFEKVSLIFEISAHYRDLVFQSNKGMTPVLIKPSQFITTTKMTI
jgi:hypothetical protein